MRRMISEKGQEVLKNIAIENGNIGTYVEGTFVALKSPSVEEGAVISIVKGASGLANKAQFDEGDYLPFYPDLGELKFFDDMGMGYWIYNDNEHRYYTSDPSKTFILQGNTEVQEGSEVVANVTKGKQFKAFKLED